MSGGLVSVVMPAFDEEAFICEAVQSVLEQTYQRFELIVVDDGSADRTAEIVTGLAAGVAQVRVLRHAARGGPAMARNTGLAEARGEYWTIFDADDVMPPERLALAVAWLRANPSFGVVLGLTEPFVTPGEPQPSHWNPRWDEGPRRAVPGTMVARREVFERVGEFDETLMTGEDIQWLARAKLAGVADGHLDEICLHYRIHAGSVSSDIYANRATILTALRTARKLETERRLRG